MPPGRSPMPQDTTSALSGLASFAKLQALLAARRHEGCAEGKMTFEAFAVALGHAVRGLENALKAADLARYDVDANAVMVDGQEWRKCLEQQPKTYLSASGPITVARNLYRPADGGKCLCPLELRAGIIGGLDTPVLARQVTSLMGPLTSDETNSGNTLLVSAEDRGPMRDVAWRARTGVSNPPMIPARSSRGQRHLPPSAGRYKFRATVIGPEALR